MVLISIDSLACARVRACACAVGGTTTPPIASIVHCAFFLLTFVLIWYIFNLSGHLCANIAFSAILTVHFYSTERSMFMDEIRVGTVQLIVPIEINTKLHMYLKSGIADQYLETIQRVFQREEECESDVDILLFLRDFRTAISRGTLFRRW